MATNSEALVELEIVPQSSDDLVPTQRSLDTLTLSEASAPDTSQLDTFSLSAELGKPTEHWQMASYKKENERLRSQVVKLRKALDSEKEQLKFIKKDAQETLVRVRREERDTLRHKHCELQLKLERQNQGQLKSSESHWQSEVVRLQGDIRQLRQETAKLKLQKQNLEAAKKHTEEDMRKLSREHESEMDTIRRAGGHDVRKQHDELRTRDKELRENKRELEHVTERALRMESKVDELEATLARLKGGLSLEKASPRALLTSKDASIGDRSFSDVTTPLHSKEAVVGGADGGEHVPRPVGDKDRLIVQKNTELSALAHRLDEKVKKLTGEKQELLDKLKKGLLPSDPLKEDNRKLSSKCSDLSNSLRRTEERERHVLGEAKRLKLNQTQLENQISAVKQELTTEKSKTIRHKLGRQQLERAQVELKRSQTELTTHKDTIRSLEKEREDLKKRIDLLKHTKELLSQERDKAMKHSSQLITEQTNVSDKEWENASQASFIQAEMDQIVFERDELKASIAQLHLEHLTLQRANNLLNELSDTSGGKEESVESGVERSDELERIENELRISNERVAELEDKLSVHPVVGLGELEEQLDTLTRSLTSTEAELSAANERICELERRITADKFEEEERQASILQLHGQIKQLREEMKANTSTHEEAMETVRAEKTRLDEQLHDKINRVTELEVSLSEAINVTSQLEDRLEQLSSEKVEIELRSEDNDASNMQLRQLETDIKTAGKELEMITNEKNVISNEVSELRESLKHMTELKEKGEIERDVLLERLEQVKQELSTAQEEKDQLRDKLASAEASLVGEQQLSENLQVLEELNKKNSEEKSVLQMKTDQLGVIECELETSRRDLGRLKDRERELEGDIRVLKLEKEESLLDLTICRESLTKEIDKLTEEKSSLVEVYSMQLSEAQSEIDSLRSVANRTEVPSEGMAPDTVLQSRLELLTQQLEEAHTQRDKQEREREETLLTKQTELDQVQYNLQDTEGKLAEALQSALQMSRVEPVSLDSPAHVNDSEMKQELKVQVEAALVNLRDGVDGSTETHIRAIQRIIEHMSFTQNHETTGNSDEFSFNNIVVEIDNEKEMLRQELAEIQEAFSALEEELEETRSALQSFQNQEKDLTQKNKLINDLRSQVSDLKVIISSETQRNQRERSSPGSLGDEHSITASLLDSPQSRFLEPRLFVTLFDYDPMSLCTTGHPERQLPLKAGDIIVVHGDMNATAHYQATHGGTAGLVPANFIEELVISDPLARQRLLHQSLSPEKRGQESTGEPPEDTYTSSDEENISSSQTIRIPMPVSGLCVEKVFQDSIVLKWDPPHLSSSGKSNGAYILGYRVLVNNEPKKDVIGALQTKCLLEGLTSGVPLTVQILTLSDNDLSSRPCSIQHPPICSTHSRPSTASSHFSLPASLADTISPATSSSTILEPSHAVLAIYDYNAAFDSPNDNHEFELSFKEGDLITVFGSVMEDGFYFGELNGKKGLVPSNFVQESSDSEIQILDTSQVISPAENRPQSSDSQSLPVSTPDPQLSKQVLALYSYDPYTMSPNENPEIELAFKEGDIIRVQGEMDKYGFFQGEMEGSSGLIPSNFVTELDADPTATRPEQSSDFLPLPEIHSPSDNDVEEVPSLRQEKPRKGVFKKGKNFVKKLGLIGSPTPRNSKS